MKKSALLLLAISPVLAIAGIIVPKSGNNIEDATNIVVSDTEILYQIGSENKVINRSDVSAIMYDDGRYEEVKEMPQNTYSYAKPQSSYNVQSQQGYSNQTATQEGYKGSLKQAKDIRTAGIIFTAVGALPIGLPMLLVGIHRVDNY